tara:strand:- start:284 stop:1717 length:1434 start_codon:yes stop_codon:yes gene_type:complete
LNKKSKDSINEFLSSTSGKLGSALLIIFFIISFFVILTYPLDFGTTIWSNPSYWSDYPKSAPPTWTALLGSTGVKHQVIEISEPDEIIDIGSQQQIIYRYKVNYNSDDFPTFLSFSLYNIEYHANPPNVELSILRPDNKELLLYRSIVSPPRPNEIAPFIRYSDSPFRINLSGDNSVSSNLVLALNKDLDEKLLVQDIIGSNEKIIFGTLEQNSINTQKTLSGEYTIIIKFLIHDNSDSISKIRFVIGGTTYGFVGTDSLGRDLYLGLLFGFPVALLIGLTTSTVTTIIGTFMGILSGYRGGKTDIVIQRLSDILSNIPLLPILIFLIFIIGPKLWLVMLILVAFGWPGLTIIVRSMVLQIRSGQSIESAKSLGASEWRIMFRHVFPQLAPFIFAQLIFFTPAAILAEASLSFLGLGDPSIPTWGQILENGFRTGGVYVDFWWLILPPGILIVITAMIFVLIALALEPIVNPKIKKI